MMKFPTDVKRCLSALVCLCMAALLLTGCDTEVTQAPEEFRVSMTADNTVLLTWEPVAEASGYRIYRRVDNAPDFKFITDTTEPHFSEPFPTTGKSCDYKVTALGPAGESAPTVCYVLGIAGETASVVPLSAPVITSVTRLDLNTNVIFFSDENTDCHYEILRQEDDKSWLPIGRTDDHVFYDTAAEEDARYHYIVRVLGSRGWIEESDSVPQNTNPKEVFGVPVLMYHEFVTQEDLDSGVAFDEYAIYYDEFEHDLRWLRDNGYTTITCMELAQYLKGEGRMPAKPVILTIDDGKLGVYKNAYPLLQEYNMKAVLAVIGSEIDTATLAPEARVGHIAPYCTWDELAEMSASGHMEIVSHSYGLHVYQHDGRTGANSGAGETIEDFLLDAYQDHRTLQSRLTDAGIPRTVSFAYPYSARSTTADAAWMQCGYELLLCGDMDSVRLSQINYFIQEAGINANSALLRRIPRMTGTPIEDYIG